ncbi:MAG: TRAM domain-containing protein, partial [Christensenellaceae bacterium]
MWKKNTELTATVVSLGSEGEGVIKTDEGILFVPFCLVGERVRVRVVKANGAVGYGKLLEILTPSPDRAEPRCTAFHICGGCALQHMRYEAQLVWKRQAVKEALRKLGGID